MNPKAIPVEMLDVIGIARMTMNAGNASSKLDHLIFDKPSIMKLPTMIKIGAVIADRLEMAEMNGEKNIVQRNSKATTTAVSPLLPPAATPAVDSTYAVEGLVPNAAPTVVASESPRNALRARGNWPFFKSPACSETATIVPVVSKIVTSRNANITLYSPFEKTPAISISKKVGAGGNVGSRSFAPISSMPLK